MVAGEGHSKAVCLAQQVAQHLPLLGGEVGEAVQPQVHPLGPGVLLQLFRRPGQPVPGVQGRPGCHGLIGPADQPQIPQLLPLRAGELMPCLEQQLRLDAAALQLVRRGQQALQECRPAGRAGIDRQLVGHRLYRLVHQQQPAAGIQLWLPHPARGQKHPVGQPAEGQHLSIQGDTVSACPAQGTLRLMGLLLRHDEHLLPPLPRLGQAGEHRSGLSGPRPSQDQFQHGPRLPSVSHSGPRSQGAVQQTLLYHTLPRKKSGGKHNVSSWNLISQRPSSAQGGLAQTLPCGISGNLYQTKRNAAAKCSLLSPPLVFPARMWYHVIAMTGRHFHAKEDFLWTISSWICPGMNCSP